MGYKDTLGKAKGIQPLRFSLIASVFFLVFSSLQLMPAQVFAAAIPTTALHTASGAGSATSQGDYISSSAGMNTYYSYWIEVPSGASQLRLDVFDADIGAGGANGVGDAQRGGNWNTCVNYRLIDPGGTTQASVTVGGSCGFNCGFCNNSWQNLYNTASPASGHWELRVDMSSTRTTGDDVNGFALRVHDGDTTSGGTELNIYAESFADVGPVSGSNTYELYPFITSGCTTDSNDFDFDSNGSITLTSRSGAFSQTNPSVSGNDTWLNTPLTGWTTDTRSVDYGVWNSSLTLSSGPNYGTFYMGDFNASNPPPTGQPEANTFRMYLPTDGGSAPVKPVLTQTLSYVSGPNPPVSGSTTRVSVQVTIVNNTLFPIIFSSSNLITANLPGSGAVYADNASVTQGTVTGEPSIGGTGNITWNPGTVSAGTSATLSYDVDVTPASSGQRIPVTGTPASNGTTATYVDETGNTSQARATYTYGPICELAVTEGGTPTLAVISAFKAYQDRGKIVLQWETTSEVGTVGFYLLRRDDSTGEYLALNKELLPGLLHSSQGGIYRFLDKTASPGESWTYKLTEVEVRGKRRIYGPFTVTTAGQDIDPSLEPFERTGSNYSKKPHGVSASKKARIKSNKASRNAAKAAKKQRIGDRAKISISSDSLYFVSTSDISRLLDIPYQRAVKKINRIELALTNQGKIVAYLPAEDNSGIYFYGQGIDSLYTDENIYWLYQGRGLRMERLEGEEPALGTGYETFTKTVHIEEDLYAGTSLFIDPAADYWLWDYIISGYPGMDRKTFTVEADSAADVPSTAALTVHLQGGTDTDANPDHHVVISLNGTEIGEDRWEGVEPRVLVLSFSQDLLFEGANTVEVQGILDTGVAYSIFHVDSFDLTYQRLYHAAGNTLLCQGDENSTVTIDGFTNPDIFLFDVTDPQRPKLNRAATIDNTDGNYRMSFFPLTPDTVYLALSLDAVSIADAWADTPSRLRSRNNIADYMIIATEELLGDLQSLADYREQQGLISMVVMLKDIMDEFNYGIFSPDALRDFLSYTYFYWEKAPRYVVLAGEGTFDYKDILGYGDNLVPPVMVGTPNGLFPSDNYIADFNGDYLPEMAVGRLPVVTAGELQDLIAKIIDYENSGGGAWEKQVLMLADDPDYGGDFPSDSDDVSVLFPYDYTVEKIYLSDHSLDEARVLVLDGINRGALFLNYIGHAGVDRMAQEGLLLTSDVDSMTNLERLPVVTAMTCVMGQYALPGYDSLSEAFVLKQNGGAVAVWAPTGMSLNSEAIILDKAFFRSFFLDGEQVLGDLVLKAIEEYSRSGNEPYMLDIYNLIGDPALKIRR